MWRSFFSWKLTVRLSKASGCSDTCYHHVLCSSRYCLFRNSVAKIFGIRIGKSTTFIMFVQSDFLRHSGVGSSNADSTTSYRQLRMSCRVAVFSNYSEKYSSIVFVSDHWSYRVHLLLIQIFL